MQCFKSTISRVNTESNREDSATLIISGVIEKVPFLCLAADESRCIHEYGVSLLTETA